MPADQAEIHGTDRHPAPDTQQPSQQETGTKAEKAIYLSVPPLHFDCLKSRPTVSEAQFEFLGEASSCILFS